MVGVQSPTVMLVIAWRKLDYGSIKCLSPRVCFTRWRRGPALSAAVVSSAQHCSPHTMAPCCLRGKGGVGCRQLACHTRLHCVHSVSMPPVLYVSHWSFLAPSQWWCSMAFLQLFASFKESAQVASCSEGKDVPPAHSRRGGCPRGHSGYSTAGVLEYILHATVRMGNALNMAWAENHLFLVKRTDLPTLGSNMISVHNPASSHGPMRYAQLMSQVSV
jgi:hypothetical protein